MGNQKDLLYSTGNSAQCYVAVWMGEKFGGEWTHIYVWLSPFTVHLKISQIVNQLYPNTKVNVLSKCLKKDQSVLELDCGLSVAVAAAAAAAKLLQSCLTLCDPIHGSPPGSPVHGILQARTLEWVAIAFSNA